MSSIPIQMIFETPRILPEGRYFAGFFGSSEELRTVTMQFFSTLRPNFKSPLYYQNEGEDYSVSLSGQKWFTEVNPNLSSLVLVDLPKYIDEVAFTFTDEYVPSNMNSLNWVCFIYLEDKFTHFETNDSGFFHEITLQNNQTVDLAEYITGINGTSYTIFPHNNDIATFNPLIDISYVPDSQAALDSYFAHEGLVLNFLEIDLRKAQLQIEENRRKLEGAEALTAEEISSIQAKNAV